jgi:hypothetical protein
MVLLSLLVLASSPLFGSKPEVFANGVISTGEFESHLEIEPSGKRLYFVKSNPEFSFWTIYVSERKGKGWGKPAVAPFSGKYRDADPFITSDGRYFFFISDRLSRRGRRKRIWTSGIWSAGGMELGGSR